MSEMEVHEKGWRRDVKNQFHEKCYIYIHGRLLEGLEENAPDFTTYEFLELLALTGLALFFYEWLRVLKSIR